MPKTGPSVTQILSGMLSSSWALKTSQTDCPASLGTSPRTAPPAWWAKLSLTHSLSLPGCAQYLCPRGERPQLSHLSSSPSPPPHNTCSSPGQMVALCWIPSLSLSSCRHHPPDAASAAPAPGDNSIPCLADLDFWIVIYPVSLISPRSSPLGLVWDSQLSAGFSIPSTELWASPCQTSWGFN